MRSATWCEPGDDGCVLRVHVRPGAERAGVVGLHGDAVAVRVRARPIEGAANRELTAVLAEALGVPVRDVVIAAGERGRTKRVLVRGLGVAAARERLGSRGVR